MDALISHQDVLNLGTCSSKKSERPVAIDMHHQDCVFYTLYGKSLAERGNCIQSAPVNLKTQ